MADTTCKLMDLGCHAKWIQDEVKGFFVWIAEQIFSGVTAVLNAIPLPDWASSSSDVLSSIPGSVGYFLNPLAIGSGLSIIISAYGIRFLIRRIPFIG